eukprot:TRINITY_DN9815_c0_g3_i1.p1 TRINITY_DN9815_c0_g3~~TRINITY_DN9815_c0_g3_i1.p1  ORF type:complete len:208 (+),score=66.85 TRINITY_DN9815_c0_g3_i1:39-626(+)
MEKVYVKTSDDAVFELETRVANMCATLKNMLEDLDGNVSEDAPIPLNNVRKDAMERVQKWADHHKDDVEPDDDMEKARIATELDPWDKELFQDLNMRKLFDVIMAANFLDIKGLLDTACKDVAIRIKGKDLKEILALFDIDREITMEDKKKAMRNHPWLMDGCEIIPEHKEIKEAILEEDRLKEEAEAKAKEEKK